MHWILAHVSIAALIKLWLEHPKGMDIDKKSDDQFQCKPYMRTKQHVVLFPDKASHTLDKLKIGEIVVSDSWRPVQVWSIHGYLYYMSMTNLKSHFLGVYFSATKVNLALNSLIDFRAVIQRMSWTKSSIMCLRVDNSTKYINKKFMEYCKSNGIAIKTTAPHFPAQNSVAK
jgi:hypothetical protein